MKRLFQHSSLVLLLSILYVSVRADVGETYELKRNRAALLQQMEMLRSGSTNSAIEAQLESLTQKVIELDGRIFNSYAQTVDRLATRKTDRTISDRWLALLALVATAIAVFLSALIMMARNRVMEKEKTGLMAVYRQLSADFIGKVSQEKTGEYRLLRVNVVVILGLVMMSVSVLAYLIGSI